MLFLFAGQTYAQNNSKWDTQGNIADSSTFIGTTNAACLRFRSNDIERMRINEDGNVGIGVSNPIKKLDVDGDIQLTGDIIFKGYEDLQDTITRFLMLDKYGKSKYINYNRLKSSLYAVDCYKMVESYAMDGLPGNPAIIAAYMPSWASRVEGLKSILYTGTICPAWVGIGTNLPQARLDVRGAGHFAEGLRVGHEAPVSSGLYIENKDLGGNQFLFENLILVKDHADRKLLQLNNDGLLRAREIKVDLASWPDFVFHKDYILMPLNEVQNFIAQNGHLPNVPSAKEIEEDGVNLGEAAKTSMQKIEELTLYLLEVNEKVEKQQEQREQQEKKSIEQEKRNIEQAETIKLQQELLQQQQETIRLQQQLIEELKKETSKR